MINATIWLETRTLSPITPSKQSHPHPFKTKRLPNTTTMAFEIETTGLPSYCVYHLRCRLCQFCLETGDSVVACGLLCRLSAFASTHASQISKSGEVCPTSLSNQAIAACATMTVLTLSFTDVVPPFSAPSFPQAFQTARKANQTLSSSTGDASGSPAASGRLDPVSSLPQSTVSSRCPVKANGGSITSGPALRRTWQGPCQLGSRSMSSR